MYNNVLGVVEARQENNESLYDVFCDVSEICDQLIVSDPNSILNGEEIKMLKTSFDAEITDNRIDEIDYYSNRPEWVYAGYSDERPSRRFKYMKVSLCMNPFINTWMGRLRYLWNEEYQYRVDRGWARFEKPFLYRFIEEIDYKWDGNLVPENQIGPTENCMLDLYSYRFLKETNRETIYDKYMKKRDKCTADERRQYDSLLDLEIMVTQAVY